LKTTTIDGKRHYITPSGILPSVTTVLSDKLDKSALDVWRAKIGYEEADKISTMAAVRGTSIHNICEKYVRNDLSWSHGVMPVNIDTFNRIRTVLDAHIGIVSMIEGTLYSAKLHTAGRSDLIAMYDDVMSVIDFKTSRRTKKEKWIEGYFLQATCYSMMAEELTNLIIPQIVLIIAVDDAPTQVFVKERRLYEDRVLEIFRC
jgi:hypothetical protein